jgi:pimeloyl-ACP methyl ester carboxylesterase
MQQSDSSASAASLSASDSIAHVASRTETISILGLDYHVRHWGNPKARKLFLCHGWMDVGASFQFVVDALQHDWHVIAPDWRGFGLTGWTTAQPGTVSYWYPDYLADLEALLDHYQPEGQVDLVGHSMGANIVGIYAGVRPARVRSVVSLEGFGLAAGQPHQAPERYARWLDEIKAPPGLRPYESMQAVIGRLQKTNPRLTDAQAAFLAPHWARQNEDGQWALLADPAHRIVNPILYRLEEIMAVWAQVTAPVLHVEAKDSATLKWIAGEVPLETFRTRFSVFKDFREIVIDDAGHMLHHDQPVAVAQAIEAFVR